MKPPRKRNEPNRTPDNSSAPAPVPFKPRRRLFIILLATFFVWMALLLVMYLTTVYPHTHPTTHPVPASST